MDLTAIVGMDQMDLVVMLKTYQTLKLEFMSLQLVMGMVVYTLILSP